MLTLTRRIGQEIRIGDDIRILVKEIKGRQVRIGIEAPPGIPIYREEIYKEIVAEMGQAVAPDADLLDSIIMPSDSDEVSVTQAQTVKTEIKNTTVKPFIRKNKKNNDKKGEK